MTRIAVIGPGAIGGALAAWLAQNSAHEVIVCARTPFTQLTVEAPGATISAAPRVIVDPARGEPVDFVLICTKTYDSAGAAVWLPTLTRAATRVAVIQNGVEHVARFAPFFDAARIIACMIDLPAERKAPGHIQQRRNGILVAPQTADGAALVALFAHTPIDARVTPDITTTLWRKLCINCAGAVNAATLKPAGVARREDIGALMRALAAECVAVGRAEGADLPDDLPDNVVAGYRAADPDSVNSLLADRLAGRPMELDARNGVIVRLGAKHGIATPMNAALAALIDAASA